MNQLINELESIRQAGMQGDADANSKCVARFGAGLHRVIRRTLISGRSTNSLTNFIFEEARRIRDEQGLERDDLVSELASRLVALIVGQGCEGRLDTVQLAGESTVTAA